MEGWGWKTQTNTEPQAGGHTHPLTFPGVGVTKHGPALRHLYLPHLLISEAAIDHAVGLFVTGSKVLLLGAIMSLHSP